MKITNIPGDDDAYQVPAKLVNWLVYSILASLLAIGGYMVTWNRSDSQWKTALMVRMEAINEKIGSLQTKIDTGILPRTEERINAISDRIRTIEREHEHRFYSAPQKALPPP